MPRHRPAVSSPSHGSDCGEDPAPRDPDFHRATEPRNGLPKTIHDPGVILRDRRLLDDCR